MLLEGSVLHWRSLVRTAGILRFGIKINVSHFPSRPKMDASELKRKKVSENHGHQLVFNDAVEKVSQVKLNALNSLFCSRSAGCFFAGSTEPCQQTRLEIIVQTGKVVCMLLLSQEKPGFTRQRERSCFHSLISLNVWDPLIKSWVKIQAVTRRQRSHGSFDGVPVSTHEMMLQ